MRAGRKSGVLRVLAAAAALSLLAGCQIPRASVGHEPLQTRFAALARQAVEARSKGRPPKPDMRPERVTSAAPVVIARGM